MAIFNNSIAMLVYQRVCPINIPLNHYKIPLNHYNKPCPVVSRHPSLRSRSAAPDSQEPSRCKNGEKRWIQKNDGKMMEK